MGIMIQIRNVPDDLHRKLKSRAALSSKSLSQYLLDEIEQIASRPDQTEIQARLRTRSSVDLGAAPVAAAVREERDTR
jgi:antitoxin FitA